MINNFIKENAEKFIILICIFFSILVLLNAWYGFPIFANINSYYGSFQGVFPHSDAGGYFEGPKIFASSGYLDSWNTRRPFTSLYYSSLNLISSNNFYISLILRNIIFALSLSTALIVIYKKFGFQTLFISSIFIFPYSSFYICTTLSETVGLTLGLLSFSICLYAIEKNSSFFFLLGIFCFCISLNARSGSFFILPCLVLYYSINFSIKHNYIHKFKNLVYATSAVICAFLFSLFLCKYFGEQSGNGQMHSNFAPTLYGLVHGGTGWLDAYNKYPNFTGSEAEFAKLLYLDSLKYFLSHPQYIILGFIKNLGSGINSFLIFGRILPRYVNLVFSFLFILLTIYTFIKIRKNNQKLIDFLSIGLVSYFLSACFIAQDGGIRVFASTIIFNIISIAITISYIIRKSNIKSLELNKKDIIFPITIISIVFSLTFILTIFQQNYALKSTYNFISKLKCNPNELNEIIENPAKQPYIYFDKTSELSKKNYKFLERNHAAYNDLIIKSEIEYKKFFQELIYESKDSFILGKFSNQYGKTKFFMTDKNILKDKSKFIEICYTSKSIDNIMLGKISKFQSISREEKFQNISLSTN